MPHYRVWAKRIEYEYLDVEARDTDHANRKAAATDDGYPAGWRPTDDIEWEILPGETEELSEVGDTIALGAS